MLRQIAGFPSSNGVRKADVRVSVRREQFTDETPDFTAASSVQRASTVEYMGKNYNSFMYNFPMAVSPDGTQAVMADQAGFLCVYDPRTNELLDTVSSEKYNSFLSVACAAADGDGEE